MNVLSRYARWLHLKWPAGTVENLPRVNEDGSTNVPGLYVVGDLTGIPLLKFSSDTGARVVRLIAQDRQTSDHLDLVIIGAGVSGMAAALEAKKLGLNFEILESSEAFFTVVNFPARKPIFTYPSGMTPAGDLQFREEVHPKETLLEDLRRGTMGIAPRRAAVESVTRKGDLLQVNLEGDDAPLLARRVIVAIGRSGNFRKLEVPGEDLDKVYNRLHDPKDFAGKRIVVVGGGDSALETAIALAEVGCDVTIAYRGAQFSRPKPDNIERLAALPVKVLFVTRVAEIRQDEVVLTAADGGLGVSPERLPRSGWPPQSLGQDAQATNIPNDAVFTMIGREPPLEFFRKSGVKIRGEWRVANIVGLVAFVLFCFWLYHWKSGHALPFVGGLPAWLNFNPSRVGTWFTDRTTLLGTIAHSASGRAFYYTLAYSTIIVVFGIRR
ncbi:MAG: NosR/NirI family transcriptional regulator, nitrous oxide reductase regulator, partial [Humisphaera sp.]|nr:NosR/NirI family transcriptional regulator, nitrous oxide reductase regulator [Humisphaera sp.]